MASTFPTTIDNFTDPLSTSPLNSPSHSLQHANINDAVEKIETKLGTGTPTGTAIGVYSAYTPSFSGFTLSDGTVTTRWTQVNKQVHYYGRVVLGSSSAFTGALDISLPININAASVVLDTIGTCGAYNGSVLFYGAPINLFNHSIRCTFFLASGTYVSNTDTSATVPFTWANGNIFFWNITYESV